MNPGCVDGGRWAKKIRRASSAAGGWSRGTLKRVDQLKRVYDMDYGLAELQTRLFTDRR